MRASTLVLALALCLGSGCGPSAHENERAASAALKLFATAEADFRANDRDANGIQDFWIGDVAGLHDLVPVGGSEPIRLIPAEIAAADASRPDAKPYHGYLFRPLEKDDDGKPYAVAPGKTDRHLSKFGFCAYPAGPGKTGKFTFYVNEGNTVFRKPAKDAPILVFPGTDDVWDDAPPAPDLPILEVKDADADLKRTRIVSDLDAPHEPGRNLVWWNPTTPAPSAPGNPDRPMEPFPMSILFRDSFERFPGTFSFDGRPVHAFGVRPKGARGNACWQVVPHRYVSPTDFVAGLPVNGEERILIARLPTGRTLRETVMTAIDRTTPAGTLWQEDELRIPCFAFGLGRRSLPGLRFRMDETGTRKVAPFGGYFSGSSAEGPPIPPKKLICDGPFLFMQFKKGAELPYFAMWIENAELLCPK